MPALYKPIHVLHLPSPNNQCLSPLHLPCLQNLFSEKGTVEASALSRACHSGDWSHLPISHNITPHRAFHLMIRLEGKREVRWVHLRLPILFVPAAYEVLDWRSPSMFWYLVVRLAPAHSRSDGPVCFGRSILLGEMLWISSMNLCWINILFFQPSLWWVMDSWLAEPLTIWVISWGADDKSQ